MLKWIPFSDKLKDLAFFIQQKANSREANRALFFSALESIIIPIPTDPLMAAVCICCAKTMVANCVFDCKLLRTWGTNWLGHWMVFWRFY